MLNTWTIDAIGIDGLKQAATGHTVTVYEFSLADMPLRAPNGALLGTCTEVAGTGQYSLELTASKKVTVAVNGKAVAGLIGVQGNGNTALDDWVDTSAIQDAAVTPQKASFVIVEEDDFTGINGTALTTHNAKWSLDSGSAEIQNNQLDILTTVFRAYMGTTKSDVQISATVRVTASSGWQCGIMLRRQDANNYLICDIQEALDVIRIYRVVAGTPAGISQLSVPIASDVTYTLTATATGSNIDFQVNSFIQSKTESTFQTETDHGLYEGFGNNNAVFDNFVISNIF